MKHVIRLFACLLLLYTTISSEAQSKDPVYSDETEMRIKQVENGLAGWVQIDGSNSTWNIHDRMKHHNVHGVSIAVIKDYKIDWARGYGWADTSDRRRVTVRTLFQAASISKSLNAMGVLQLADKKKIRLDGNINDYLQSWKFPEDSFTRKNKITVAHLLSHTAGLSVHGFPGYSWKDSIPEDNDILDGKRPANTGAVRSVFEPGLRFQYSGGGTTITKKIIMDVSEQAYDMYMWKQVMEPIGMTGSFYTQPPPPQAFTSLATAYFTNGKPVNGKFHIYPEQAPDGLWTNPADLARYIIEMQLSLQGKSNKVLSKEMTTTMLTPYVDKSAALGVFIDTKGGQQYFQHAGSNRGFRCQYYGSMENGSGVVVMVNSDNGNIIPEIINSVATVYEWSGFYTPEIKKLATVHADTLKDYTGKYRLGDIRLTVSMQDDKLFISQDGSPAIEMYFTSETEFFIYEVRANLQFLRNDEGVVNALLIRQNGEEYKAIRQ